MLRKVTYSLIVSLLFVFPARAQTVQSQCSGLISQLWVTDGGELYVFLVGGLLSLMGPSDPNYNGSLALATSAFMAGRPVSLRVTAATCGGGVFYPLVGVGLLAS